MAKEEKISKEQEELNHYRETGEAYLAEEDKNIDFSISPEAKKETDE